MTKTLFATMPPAIFQCSPVYAAYSGSEGWSFFICEKIRAAESPAARRAASQMVSDRMWMVPSHVGEPDERWTDLRAAGVLAMVQGSERARGWAAWVEPAYNTSA